MNADLIYFFAAGIPKGQPRPRAFAFKGSVRIYNPAQAESWKSQIALAAKEYIPESPLAGPLCCDLTFYFPRPKSHFRSGELSACLKINAPLWCVSKPDRDNADKAVLDCLKTLGFFVDDAQVVDGSIRKMYAAQFAKSGCLISLSRVAFERVSPREAAFLQAEPAQVELI